MEQINNLLSEKLKLGMLQDFWGLLAIIAAALLLILLITIIAAAVSGAKKKKKIKKLEAKLKNAGRPGMTEEEETQIRAEIEAEIRAEVTESVRKETEEQLRGEYAANATEPTAQPDTAALEAQIREQVEAEVRSEYAELYAARPQEETATDNAAELQSEIDELNAIIADKNNRIDELGELLMQASDDHKSDNGELYVQINTLNRDNTALQKQVNELQAENAQLKNAAAVSRTATAKRTTEPKATASRAKSSTPKTAAPKTTALKTSFPKTVPLDDDDADEIYNDYGDSTSAVKVTLKYDRVKSSWVIYRSDTTRAYRRIGTKQEAMVVAKDLAKRLHAQLVVHKKDGKFQKL